MKKALFYRKVLLIFLCSFTTYISYAQLGVTWVQHSVPLNNNYTSIAFGNGVFVAVTPLGSAGSSVMSSADGANWTFHSSPGIGGWRTVTFGNGIFVAIGNGNIAMTSTDGVTWTSRNIGGSGQWINITYGNGKFVALGYDSASEISNVTTSTDGITWTAPTLVANYRVLALTYGNGLYVAAFENLKMFTSPDGLTWTEGIDYPEYMFLREIIFANGMFVAVSSNGFNNKVLTSTDGQNWTTRSIPVDNVGLVAVAYGNGLYVAIGNKFSTPVRKSAIASDAKIIFTSPDAINWTAQDVLNFTYNSIAFGNGIFSAIGDGALITSGPFCDSPAPTATSPQNFCGTSQHVSDLVATGTDLKWYNVPTDGTALANTDALVTGTYYVSQNTGICESLRTPVTVGIAPANPTASVSITPPSRCEEWADVNINNVSSFIIIGQANFNDVNMPSNFARYGGSDFDNGEFELNPPNANSSGMLICTPTNGPNSFTASFMINSYKNTENSNTIVADGMSFNFGVIDPPNTSGSENGILTGNGLVVRFLEYQTQRIQIVVNGTLIYSVNADIHYPTARRVMVSVSESGKLWLRLGKTILINGVDLGSAYASANKSNWKFGWGARSGGATNRHAIDDVSIYDNNGTEFSYNNFASSSAMPFFTSPGGLNIRVKIGKSFCNTDLGLAYIPQFANTFNGNFYAIAEYHNFITCDKTFIIGQNLEPQQIAWSDFASRPTLTNFSDLGNTSFFGEAELTTNANNQNGRIIFPATPNASIFDAKFRARIWDGNAADGFSFNYGHINDPGGGNGGLINSSATNGGLSICFSTWNGEKMEVKYKGQVLHTINISGALLRNPAYSTYRIMVEQGNFLSVFLNSGTLLLRFDLGSVSTYATDDHSNWQIAFGARTGGQNDKHTIDDVDVKARPAISYSLDGGNTYQTNTITTNSTSPINIKIKLEGGCVIEDKQLVVMNPLPNLTSTVTISHTPNTTQIYANCLLPICEIEGLTANNHNISGDVEAKVWIKSGQPTGYVKRHYQITPTTNSSTAKAKVKLYFTQQEFNSYNTVNNQKLPTMATDALGKANLRIEKRAGSGDPITGLPETYTDPGTITIIDPIDTDIVLNSAGIWEVSFETEGFSGFFVNTNTAALPVNLISFTGKHENGQNILNWKTSNEKNFSHFEVERSENGKSFEKIGKVDGTKAEVYDFTDKNSSLITYQSSLFYRLKMVDLDGSSDFSKIIALQNKEKEALVGNFYPNPATNDEATINITTDKAENWTITSYDLTGRVIKNEIKSLNQGENKLKIMLEKGSGIQLFRFESDKEVQYRKIVK